MGDKELIKETTEQKLLTEDRFMELLGENFYAIEELMKSLENRICYRVYKGLRKQLSDK